MFNDVYRNLNIFHELGESQRALVRQRVGTMPNIELILMLSELQSAGSLKPARLTDRRLDAVLRRLNAPFIIAAACVAAVGASIGSQL